MKKIRVVMVSMMLTYLLNAQSIPKWKATNITSYFTQETDSIYVINFWATICKPCIAEIPHLQSISRKYAASKVKLLLVSPDLPSFYPGKIDAFVKKKQVSAAVSWLDETNADYF